MRRNFETMLVAMLAVLCLVRPVEAQTEGGEDPFHGVWKLNLDRSVFSPGPRPAGDFQMFYQFAPLDDGSTRFTLVNNGTPQGDLAFQMTVFRIDGERRPVYTLAAIENLLASGEQSNVSRSYRRIDENTVEFVTYTDGAPGDPVIRELLPDGDTYVQRPANGQGSVLVFDRVR